MFKNFLTSIFLTFLLFMLVFIAKNENRKEISSSSPLRQGYAGQASSRFTNNQTPIINPLTLENIFSEDHSWTNNLPQDKTITLIATGDVMLGRTVNAHNIQINDFNYPFEKTAEFLKSSDVTLINLEGPFHNPCPIKNDGMIFCGDVRNIEGLRYAGIDVANLANNHSSNYGNEGIIQTEQLLNDSGILMTGVSGPIFKNIKGAKIAFLGYNDIDPRYAGLTPADPKVISKEITDTKKNSDLVVVSFHWGVEYQPQPSTKQKYLAHLAIDSGADLIIGNHPHWYQPVEIYKNKIIVYSHGNFIFDQPWSQKTQEGIVGKYTIYNGQIVDLEFLPVQIDHGQPSFADNTNKIPLLHDLQTQSLLLKQRQLDIIPQ